MKQIAQNIFRAIHEGKWLSIEYKNKKEEKTNYWIAVHNINVKNRTMSVEGLHLTEHSVKEFKYIYIDSIVKATVVEASYCERAQHLLDDMDMYPEKYEPLFGEAINLKILNYLIECSRLDTQPYECEYALIKSLDTDCLKQGEKCQTRSSVCNGISQTVAGC